jgi:hypothetical protein
LTRQKSNLLKKSIKASYTESEVVTEGTTMPATLFA